MEKKFIIFLFFFGGVNLFSFDPFDKEISDYFDNMFRHHSRQIKNKGEGWSLVAEENFPHCNTSEPYKITINRSNIDLFDIDIETNQIIDNSNVKSEKYDQYAKININLDGAHYSIILQKNRLAISIESSKKIKNNNNTKYVCSSSKSSREEILDKNIDLNTLKMIIEKETGRVKITALYLDPQKQKNDGIETEYK